MAADFFGDIPACGRDLDEEATADGEAAADEGEDCAVAADVEVDLDVAGEANYVEGEEGEIAVDEDEGVSAEGEAVGDAGVDDEDKVEDGDVDVGGGIDEGGVDDAVAREGEADEEDGDSDDDDEKDGTVGRGRNPEQWTVACMNVDGASGDATWADVARLAGLGVGLGGVVMLQDMRWAREEVSRQAAKLGRRRTGDVEEHSWRWEASVPSQLRMEADSKCGLKVMGGCLVAAWGELGRRASTVQHGSGSEGRWAALCVCGRGVEKSTVFVSCYRAPGTTVAKGGGLVVRQATLGDLGTARAVHEAFYRDLGVAVEAWRAAGMEVVIGGDWNADPETTTASGEGLRTFMRQWDLVEWLAEGGQATFVRSASRGRVTRSRLDHLLVSRGWAEANMEQCVKVQRVIGREEGHRMLVGELGEHFTQWLGLDAGYKEREREWRRGWRATRRATKRRPLLVEGDRVAAFQKELKDNWTGKAEEMGLWVRELAEAAEILARAEGKEDAAESSTEAEETEVEEEETEPAGRKYTPTGLPWEELATKVEGRINEMMLAAAWVAGERKGRAGSRRAVEGWYPGVGEDRKEVKWLDRLLAWGRRGRWARVRRWAGRVTRTDGAELFPLPVPRNAGERLSWLVRGSKRLQAVKRRMQGAARQETRRLCGDRMRKRQKLFAEGRVGGVARLVRDRRTGGGVWRRILKQDGQEAEGRMAVQAATSAHFDRAFGGGVKVDQLDARSRALKELAADRCLGAQWRADMLEGRCPPEVLSSLGVEQATRAVEMLQRKEGVVDGWHADWLGRISAGEWKKVVHSRAKTASPGASGVGPDMWQAAPEWLHDHARAFYSALMRLCIMPRQWRREVLVPIPKKPGERRIDQLRPLKLLEVSRKLVMGVVKDRMRAQVEGAGLLGPNQFGFRSGRSCHAAATRVMSIIEIARRDGADVHAVFLDIKKAYDSVGRGLGLEAALRRFGINQSVVNWLMEGYRDSQTSVRTGWEDLDAEERVQTPWFQCEQGFTQGAPESPILWNIFFDMALAQLEREGVGSSVRLDQAGGAGLTAFADDTTIMEGGLERMQASMDIVRKVLELLGLEVAGNKSQHLALRFVRFQGRRNFKLKCEEARPDLLTMGGESVPMVEHDFGLRYLGIWIEACSDWGEQVALLEQRCKEFCDRLRGVKMSIGEARYLVRAVLTPRIMYPLVVAGLALEEVDKLESKVWYQIARKFGLHRSAPRALLGMPLALGGMGMEAWSDRVLKARLRLAMELRYSKEEWARDVWLAMRRDLNQVSDWGTVAVGGVQTGMAERLRVAEANGHYGWLQRLDSDMRSRGVEWEDGGGSLEGREDDKRATLLIEGIKDRTKRRDLSAAMHKAGWQLMSDIFSRTGGGIPWADVPGCEVLGALCSARWAVRGNWLRGEGCQVDEMEDASIREGTWVASREDGRLVGRVYRIYRRRTGGRVACVEPYAGEWAPQGDEAGWSVWLQAEGGEWPWWERAGEAQTEEWTLTELYRVWGVEVGPEAGRAASQGRRRGGRGGQPNLRGRPVVPPKRRSIWCWEAGRIMSTDGQRRVREVEDTGAWRRAVQAEVRGEGIVLEGSVEGLQDIVSEAGRLGLVIVVASDGSMQTGFPPTEQSVWPRKMIAGGWAVGILEEGEAEAKGGKCTWRFRGGARVMSNEWDTASAYTGEVVGLVGALRAVVAGQTEPGTEREGVAAGVKVLQFIDNKAVVERWNRGPEATFTSRSRRLAEHRWWEEVWRLRKLWLAQEGNSWEVRWVKAHPEKKKDKEEWNAAECGNVLADEAAAAAILESQAAISSGIPSVVSGAVWAKVQGGLLQELRSGLAHGLSKVGQARLTHAYLEQRWARRRGEGKPMPPLYADEWGRGGVGWDTRPWRGSKIIFGDGRLVSFRLKLWWNHLGTGEVRARGKTGGEAEEAAQCSLCTSRSKQTRWHLLGECMCPELVALREAQALTMRAAGRKICGSRAAGNSTLGPKIERQLVAEGGQWRRPEGWLGAQEEPEAGWAHNVWYGLLDPAWLDEWWRQQGVNERDGELWKQGVLAFRRLAEVAVQGCLSIWKEACHLRWRAQAAEEAEARRVERKAGLAMRVAARRRRVLAPHEVTEVRRTRAVLRKEQRTAAESWSDLKVLKWGQKRRERLAKLKRTRRGEGAKGGSVGGGRSEPQNRASARGDSGTQGAGQRRLIQPSLFRYKFTDLSEQAVRERRETRAGIG